MTGSKHLRNPDSSSPSDSMGGGSSYAGGGSGYFTPGPWVVCNDNIVRFYFYNFTLLSGFRVQGSVKSCMYNGTHHIAVMFY